MGKEEFLLEQFKSLRSEIADNIKESRKREGFLVVGLGAFWAWLFSNSAISNFDVYAKACLCILPQIISLMVMGSIYHLNLKNARIGHFIKEVEKYYLNPSINLSSEDLTSLLGWENRANKTRIIPPIFQIIRVVFTNRIYPLIFAINIILGVIYLFIISSF